MKKLCLSLTMGLLCMLFLAVNSSAHVVVYPKESKQGAYEKFTVRVPTEKEIPTTKVEVRFPLDDVTISRFEPKPGWLYEVTRDDTDRITSVVWTAEGAGLSETEFGEFNMQGKIADTATSITWKAYQTYEDGTVVEWVGDPEADRPASVTHVKEAAAGSGHHDGHGAEQETAADSESQVPLYLSIAALGLAIISLFISLRKKAG